VKVAFIGMGRVGTALSMALVEAGYSLVPVEQAGLVFITTPDDAIVEAASHVSWWPDQIAVHCSGAHGPELLAPAPHAGVFHPIQTFPDRNGASRLPGSYVGIEGDERALEVLQAIARVLRMRPVLVPPGQKALYHIACVLVSNYVVTLADQAAGLWERIGLDRDTAVRALAPLMRSTVENIEAMGPVAALTGPIARGDTATVQRHIQALDQAAPDLLPVYQTLAELTRRST
jgi:predicted short-subunit dehydrogenase-like oxidoreductase (DUF2520 family)